MTREEKARYLLSSWKFWTGVAYLGLVLVVAMLFFQNGRVLDAIHKENRTEALRVATIQATAATTYTECLQSIPTYRSVNQFVDGVELLANTLLANAIATHQITPPATALYATQAANISRLQNAVAAIKTVSLPIPTPDQCAQERDAILAQRLILLAVLDGYFWHPLTGLGYQLWSGIVSDLGEYPIAVAAAVGVVGWYRRHNCHVHRCWRLQWHVHPVTGHPVCHHHHPVGRILHDPGRPHVHTIEEEP